jgi:hypothetical protein
MFNRMAGPPGMLKPVTNAVCTPISNGFFITWQNPIGLTSIPTFSISVVEVGQPDSFVQWGQAVAIFSQAEYRSIILGKTSTSNYTVKILSVENTDFSELEVQASIAPLTNNSTATTTELGISATTLAKPVNVGQTVTFDLTTTVQNGANLDQNVQVGPYAYDSGNTTITNAMTQYNTDFNTTATFIQGLLCTFSNTDGSKSLDTTTDNFTVTYKLSLTSEQLTALQNNTAYLSVFKILDTTGQYFSVSNVTDLMVVGGPVVEFSPSLPAVGGSPYIIVYGPLQNDIPCFPAGTRILTHQGYKNVEDINDKEDKVITSDGRTVPCVVVSIHIPKTNKKSAPYKIEANAFGSMSPPKDILLSPQHAIQSSKDVWQIPELVAKHNPKVYQVDLGKPITYYHIECPNYFTDNLVAEDAVVESLGWYQVSDQNVYEFDLSVGGLRRTEQKQKRYAVFEQIEQQKGLNMKLAF